MKQKIIHTLKEILRKAILPNVVLVNLIILLHWTIVSFWIYENYDAQIRIKILILGLIGGSLPVLTYTLWGLRRFWIKSYSLIHHNIISSYLKNFVEQAAGWLMSNESAQSIEAFTQNYYHKVHAYLFEKVESLPKIIRFITLRGLRKLGITQALNDQIRIIATQDKKRAAEMVNGYIEDEMLRFSESFIPSWIKYLIPVNIFLIVLLWFL